MKSNMDFWINKRGFKKKWIAEQMGISQNVLSRWINDVSMPSVENLFRLADLLGCKADDLYTRNKKGE